MSEEPRNQLCTGVNTKIELAVSPQLDVLLSAVLKPKFQASLDIVATDRIASLERKMAQMNEKVALTVTSPLSWDVQFSIRMSMFAQPRSRLTAT